MIRKQIGLSLDGETLVLKKFHGQFTSPEFKDRTWVEQNRQRLGRCAVVDVETTGLSFPESKIIELAIRPFYYDRETWQIVHVEPGYAGFEDPGEPISNETQQITGISDSDVRGKKIDWEQVNQMADSCDLIIAHNAKFDRPFVDRRSSSSQTRPWACSLSQIDWAIKGFEVQKLGVLSMFHGFFVDAHRAMNDVNAVLRILSLPSSETGHFYLKELCQSASRPRVVVYAQGSPYETKDILRTNGYRWNTQIRTWVKTVYKDLLQAEVTWLEDLIYHGKFAGKTEEIPVLRNFSVSPD